MTFKVVHARAAVSDDSFGARRPGRRCTPDVPFSPCLPHRSAPPVHPPRGRVGGVKPRPVFAERRTPPTGIINRRGAAPVAPVPSAGRRDPLEWAGFNDSRRRQLHDDIGSGNYFITTCADRNKTPTACQKWSPPRSVFVPGHVSVEPRPGLYRAARAHTRHNAELLTASPARVHD